MRAIFIFGGIILTLAMVSLLFLLEMTTGFAELLWYNWIFVQEAKIQQDLPWIGPDQQAKFYIKYNYTWNNGMYKVSEWGSAPRKTSTVQRTAYDIFAFLDQTPAAQSWPRIGEAPVAPYRFFIVSLQPAIVLMQPAPTLPKIWEDQQKMREAHPYSAESGPLDQWLLTVPEPKIFTGWIENPVEYGTHLSAGSNWEWFSPELNQAPVALPLAGSALAAIRWKNGTLVFHPEGKGWRVERRGAE